MAIMRRIKDIQNPITPVSKGEIGVDFIVGVPGVVSGSKNILKLNQFKPI